MKIKSFINWNKINEEVALRTPNTKEEYWIKKGKDGKKVALYTHDDLDGIFCAILMKKWLLNHGFEIVKYGVVNYSEGWKYTTLDSKLINIVLDFANMPGDERDELVDYYLDHHGLFSAEDLDRYKDSPVKKLATSSAYEALCIVLGLPQDELILSVIDMIDAAKYQDYGVNWQRLLDFNLEDIKKSDKKRLEFAAAFNQFLKRSDVKTLIAVIANCKDASIYGIFNAMKALYPEHNVFPRGGKKDFMKDSDWRLTQMQQRTRGKSAGVKTTITSQQELLSRFLSGNEIKPDGYFKIGDLVFVPTGTWANALRARTIVEKDFMEGRLDSEPKFILLQYGGTLQVCAYKKMKETEALPLYKDGKVIDDLGVYMTSLLENFQEHLGYFKPKNIVKLIENLINSDSELINQGVVEDNNEVTIYFTGQFTIKEDGIEKPDNKKFDLDKLKNLLSLNGLSLSNFKIGIDQYVDIISTHFKVNYISIPKSSVGQDEITVSGGHGGIGSISNIFGECNVAPYKGLRFIDMFKNKIFNDLSGVKFSISQKWGDPSEQKSKEPQMDNKVIGAEEVTKLDVYGKPVVKESRLINFKDFKIK